MPVKWLSRAEALAYLAGCREGRLATNGADGQPYIVPLNYVVQDEKIYFHCALRGRKLDNIAANDWVCFEVSEREKYIIAEAACDSATRYISVLVFGRAQLVACVQKKVEVLNAFMTKFADGGKFRRVDEAMASGCAVVMISIDQISGKRSVDPENKG